MLLKNDKILTWLWGIMVVLLVGKYVLLYIGLPNGLISEYDEGYFYINSVFTKDVAAYTAPPSLAMEVLNVLIPDMRNSDILTLRYYAFGIRSFALIFFIFSSCFYLYRRFAEWRIHVYLALIASCLLVGICAFPSIVINWNTIIYTCVTIAFSLCLLTSVFSNKYVYYALIVLVGIVTQFLFLANLPASCMLSFICFLFLIIDGGYNLKKAINVASFGLLGMGIGLIITHFFIIPIPDIHSFILENVAKTTAEGQSDAHSMRQVLLAVGFAVRDLVMTTLLLCGITYICKIVQSQFAKSWLTIVGALICFTIIYKWQVKPQIYLTSIMTWFAIMFLVYHIRHKAIKMRDIVLILFAFALPIGTVFGTNTDILKKAIWTSASWGFLLFYIYYLSRHEVRKYALFGWLVLACVIIEPWNLSFSSKQVETAHFEQQTPISRMNLNKNQKVFYDEVYDVLVKNGYKVGEDTLLGFCFNEMTVVAMGAVPYTNDAYPNEFLSHDLENVPIANYIILTEWDSAVLYNCLTELDWDFPESYSYYKCSSHPDPEMKAYHNNIQSMIYCRKRMDERVRE